MDVLLIRHAIAEDREIFALTGKDDDLRPLTAAGRKKMRKTTKGLSAVIENIDIIAHSPLIRAAQTAEIVSEIYPHAQRAEVAALAPDQAASRCASWLHKQPFDNCIALVGHEPDLGELATWFLGGDNAEPFLSFKKAGMILIHFPYKIGAGRGTLVWAMPPAILRRL
jgi:phosphohistidine phosphatase